MSELAGYIGRYLCFGSSHNFKVNHGIEKMVDPDLIVHSETNCTGFIIIQRLWDLFLQIRTCLDAHNIFATMGPRRYYNSMVKIV